jgi:hypothetical protein
LYLIVNSLEQRIQDLEEGCSDHSHSYLTGVGESHNNTLPSTGPAAFPAAAEPVPLIEEEEEEEQEKKIETAKAGSAMDLPCI